MSIFYNSLGEFQWASVAAIIAGAGAIISLIFSILSFCISKEALKHQQMMDQKKIDADIISKSRISWNQDTRKIASELINTAYMCFRTLKSYAYSCYTYWSVVEGRAVSPLYDKTTFLAEVQKENENLSEEFDKDYENFKKLFYQFKLYFGDNLENNEILKKVTEVQEQIDLIDGYRHLYQRTMGPKEAKDLVKKMDSSRISYDESISTFALSFRVYLKEEWEKAKQGK